MKRNKRIRLTIIVVADPARPSPPRRSKQSLPFSRELYCLVSFIFVPAFGGGIRGAGEYGAWLCCFCRGMVVCKSDLYTDRYSERVLRPYDSRLSSRSRG